MRFRGSYNPSFVYMTNDIVYHDGSSYIASKVVTINTPPPADGWLVLALGGRDGKPGLLGSAGSNGQPGRGIPDGGSVGQVLCKTGNDFCDAQWRTLEAGSVGAAAAKHRHSIAEIDGLEASLGMKAKAWHEHDLDQVHGLRTELNLRAAVRHSHTSEEISPGNMRCTALSIRSNANATIAMSGADGSSGVIITHDTYETSIDSTVPVKIDVQGQEAAVFHAGKVMTPLPVFCRKINTTEGINLGNASTPKSGSDTGQPGDVRWDTNYIYVCVARNTWRRTAIETW
jgi:hypothetical protein